MLQEAFKPSLDEALEYIGDDELVEVRAVCMQVSLQHDSQKTVWPFPFPWSVLADPALTPGWVLVL